MPITVQTGLGARRRILLTNKILKATAFPDFPAVFDTKDAISGLHQRSAKRCDFSRGQKGKNDLAVRMQRYDNVGINVVQGLSLTRLSPSQKAQTEIAKKSEFSQSRSGINFGQWRENNDKASSDKKGNDSGARRLPRAIRVHSFSSTVYGIYDFSGCAIRYLSSSAEVVPDCIKRLMGVVLGSDGPSSLIVVGSYSASLALSRHLRAVATCRAAISFRVDFLGETSAVRDMEIREVSQTVTFSLAGLIAVVCSAKFTKLALWQVKALVMQLSVHFRCENPLSAKKPWPAQKTIAWLIDRYLTDPFSPYHKLKPNTQQSYRYECKRIRETVGDHLLEPRSEKGVITPSVLGHDIRRWYSEWGNLQSQDRTHQDKSILLPRGRPTPSRARHCVAVLRTLLSYNVEIGTAGAGQLREMLSAMRFDGASTRTQAPTYEEVDALVAAAIEKGYRSIAITTLAQFELIERRTHIIGQWHNGNWSLGWVWDGQIEIGGEVRRVGVTSDWHIIYYQTKRVANLRHFDLKVVPQLLALIKQTPKDRRNGPVIISEDTGQPWETRRFQEKFRKIAQEAGIENNVYSMDMRAGGATEADLIPEVTDRALRDAGGWRDDQMPRRYRRKKQMNAQVVVELRQAIRNELRRRRDGQEAEFPVDRPPPTH